jgi:hypothetical protein
MHASSNLDAAAARARSVSWYTRCLDLVDGLVGEAEARGDVQRRGPAREESTSKTYAMHFGIEDPRSGRAAAPAATGCLLGPYRARTMSTVGIRSRSTTSPQALEIATRSTRAPRRRRSSRPRFTGRDPPSQPVSGRETRARAFISAALWTANSRKKGRSRKTAHARPRPSQLPRNFPHGLQRWGTL